MRRKLLRNCLLLDPEADAPRPGALLLVGGRIEARLDPRERAPDDAETFDLGGRALAPGFVDLHFHGRSIFAAPDDAPRALRHDALDRLRHGTTSFLATTVAEPTLPLAQRVSALARAISEGADTLAAPAARPIGIHLEGPWIRAEAAGAQPAAGIRDPSPGELEDLLARAEGLLRLVTLAPELPGALGLVEALTRRGSVASLGHSLADPPQVDDAVRAGARHVTHLWNAMGPTHHRAPGLAGAALARDELSCELICDGAHVHPDWVRVTARVKRHALVLVTDAIDPPPAGGALGDAALYDDGVAWRLPDGQLAGSRLTLDRAVRNATRWHAMTQLEAVAACTVRPARLLGLESEIGTLRPGARADLVALDPGDGPPEVWLGGASVSSPPEPA